MHRTSIFLLGLPLAAMLTACNPTAQKTEMIGTPDAEVPSVPPTPTSGVPGHVDVAPNGPESNQCGADKLGDFINALPTRDILDKISERIGGKTIRVVNPGDAVTMDFRPDRLNVENGEDGRIKQFRCY